MRRTITILILLLCFTNMIPTGKTIQPNVTTLVNVGLLTPQTGALSAYSPGFENAANLAIADINANASFSSYNFQLTTYDTQTTPNGATNVATQAVFDGMDYLVGAAGSSNTLAAAAVAASNQVPIISYASTSPALTIFDDHPIAGDAGYLWRIPPSDALQGKAIGDLLFDNAFSSIVIVHIDNAYGSGLANATRDTFVAHGGVLLQDIPYSQITTDFSTIVTSVASQNPTAIVMISYMTDGALLLDELALQNVNIPVIGADGIANSAMFSETPDITNSIQGVVASKPVAANTTEHDAFITEYTAAYGSANDIYIAETYDAVMAGALAILQAGSTTGPNIISALSTLSFKGASDHISFDINGDSTAGHYDYVQFRNDQMLTVGGWYQNQITYNTGDIFTWLSGPKTNVKIGLLVPETGYLSSYSQGFINAATIAINNLNSNPMFSAFSFTINTYDTQTTPVGTTNAVNTAITDGVDFLVGPASSVGTLAVGQLIATQKIPLITYSATSPDVPFFNDHYYHGDEGYIWETIPSDLVFINGFLALIDASNIRNIQVIYPDNAYGNSMKNVFETITQVTVYPSISYTEGKPDTALINSEIQASDPDVIIPIATPDDLAPILQGFANNGIQQPLLCTSSFAQLDLTQIGNGNTILTITPSDLTNSEATDFEQEYTSTYGSFSNYAFLREVNDAILAGAYAILAENSTVGYSIIQGLSSMSFNGASGEVAFDASGDRVHVSYYVGLFQHSDILRPVATWKDGILTFTDNFHNNWKTVIEIASSSSTSTTTSKQSESSAAPSVPLNYQTNQLFTIVTLIWFINRRKRDTK